MRAAPRPGHERRYLNHRPSPPILKRNTETSFKRATIMFEIMLWRASKISVIES